MWNKTCVLRYENSVGNFNINLIKLRECLQLKYVSLNLSFLFYLRHIFVIYVSNQLCDYREALKRAKLLLSMKHGLARLDNVWGVGGGQRPVMYLINKVVAMF